jgi:hypothetical protein
MQTTHNELPGVAIAGMFADVGPKDIITRLNSAKQLFSVVVTTEYNAEIFTVTIDGTGYAYTADGSATKAEIAAGVKALIDAGSDDVTTTLFTTSEVNDSFYIENNSFDDEIAVSVTNPAHGVLTLAELIDHEDAIQFGAVVVNDDRQTADALDGALLQCRLPRLATDFSSRHVLGVAMADVNKVTRLTAPYGGYSAGETVPVVRKGRIWMSVEDVASVAEGGLVYVRHVASGTEQLGAIRAADDGSDTEVLDAQQAKFTGQKITASSLAVVEWNLP